jgi:hypothetical protein
LLSLPRVQFGVERFEPRGECRALDPQGGAVTCASALGRTRESRHDCGTVAGDDCGVATGRHDCRYCRGADLARVLLSQKEKDRVPVAGGGHAADPEHGADETDSPAVRTPEGREQVSGDYEHNADGYPENSLGEKSASLPSRHD